VVVLLSLYVLFSPSQGGPTLFDNSDKVVHCALFALLAATTRCRFGGAPALLGAVAAYAVLSEVAQAVLLPNRSGDVLDLLADLAGALLGWLLARWLLERRAVPR
jgi:VanZ family protein